jgi:hypothetical protein
VKLAVLNSRSWLEQEYLVLGHSPQDIATSLGCNRVTVSKALRLAGIPIRPQTPWRIDDNGRECSKCGKYQSWSKYYSAGTKKKYGRNQKAAHRQSACNECTMKTPSRQNRAAELARFGITPEDYERLCAQQGGKCALCQHAETRSDRRRPEVVWSLAVDHDHSHCSGTRACKECIRGLLCASCNTMLGRVEQAGPPLVLRFSDYLGRRPLRMEGGGAE